MSAFPVAGYVHIKLHAQAVANAAHLVYWLTHERGGADYHRDDLLAEFAKLEARFTELRASMVEAAGA
ncbi:hypothetical protein [Brevundimonas pondensis]|uniref:Uncharacterized protein n=1 Tax=Brevundimonas pondensis TaxID=2774189 RepID=A0ABX7SK53_9CAUL|nr:hypothetical protein [Brevundimonas pondensis]QTC88077.1 hypothetical protein IFE19_01325 [Brevundimonas pondensis]